MLTAAPVSIEVTLRGGEGADGSLRYEPGDDVWGTVQVTPNADVECQHLYIRLQWHTEGRGTRDEGKIGELDVFQGTLSAGVPSAYEFRFTLPREPWSYAGQYINIVWEIAVRLDLPMARDPERGQRFIMAPRREE